MLWAWTHRWDRTLREESLKSDLQTITKVPHYALFRAIYQFIAHFLIPFMRRLNPQMHLMHSGTPESHLTPHAHIWSGRDLDMGCSFGLIRMTPLWGLELKHFHSPQVELYFLSAKFLNMQFIFSQSKIPNFLHCAPDCRAENWICSQSLLQRCRGHIIGYWSPQSIINWEL